jgi:lipoprotein NlpI
MHKLYTNCLLLTLCLAVGACSSLSLPMLGGDDSRSPKEEASVTTEQDRALIHVAQATPIPTLHSGSQALFNRGVALLREGKLDPAQVLFEELAEDQPELAGPWVNLGYIHLVRDDSEQALAAFDQALEANPRNCEALTQMGVLARKSGQFEEAELYYQSCLEVRPDYANARLNLGILYELYMGRLGEALTVYNDYQHMLPEPDNRVTGWVMDLERRVAAIATR